MNNRDLPFRSRFCHMTTLDYSMLLMYQCTITLASNIYFYIGNHNWYLVWYYYIWTLADKYVSVALITKEFEIWNLQECVGMRWDLKIFAIRCGSMLRFDWYPCDSIQHITLCADTQKHSRIRKRTLIRVLVLLFIGSWEFYKRLEWYKESS